MKNDEVTGLLQYDDFVEQTEHELRVHADSKLVLITMDFSNFNYVNNIYGYDEGDKLLKEVAEEVLIGNKGFLCGCRMYSDHFAGLFEYDEHKNWVEAFVEKHGIYIRKMRKLLSASFLQLYVGIYFWDKNVSVKNAIDKASIARKNVKGNYREPICIYLPEYENKYFKSAEMIALLKNAVMHDGVVVELQPKISMKTGKIMGAEALARLKGPDGRIYMPSEFISTLESVGYVTALDNAVLRKVLKVLKEWQENDYDIVPISVNWSYAHFQHPTLAADLKNLVDKAEVDAHNIEFEVTERVFSEDLDIIIKRISDMRKVGFKISVDDFGTGYTSFNIMGLLPIDTIKLDKGFVDSCLNNERGKQIIQGVIDIIRKVELQVLCEGVETEEDAKMLVAFGCENVQGYLYDKPLSIETFEEKYMKKS